jgi:hypothetical protein
MTATGKAEKLNLQIEGPGRYKVMADFEGADPITRVAITGKDAQVTIVEGPRKMYLGGKHQPDSGKAAVMYLLAGAKEEVKRSDDVMRIVAALLQTAGPDAVMERLAGITGPRNAGSTEPSSKPTADTVPASRSTSGEAARRWAERKEAMLRDNEVATAVELARITSSNAANRASRASEWRANDRIFGVHNGRQLVYPLFQIKEGRPHGIVGEVLKRLRPKMTDWEIFAWFTAPDMWSCRGRAPKDLLDEEPEAVIEAARHAVAESWD